MRTKSSAIEHVFNLAHLYVCEEMQRRANKGDFAGAQKLRGPERRILELKAKVCGGEPSTNPLWKQKPKRYIGGL